MQHILPKIKTSSLSIKIELPWKKTLKSSLCETDITVSWPNFISSEAFGTRSKDICLLDDSALHLDHKYLQ